MADKFSKEIRSKIMSKIKSKRTNPELRYKIKRPNLDYQPKTFGNPDFIDWNNKTVIFIDGCFWHQCPKHSKMPKSNRGYWIPKLKRNVRRDREITISYKKAGWKVKRIWEHSLS